MLDVFLEIAEEEDIIQMLKDSKKKVCKILDEVKNIDENWSYIEIHEWNKLMEKFFSLNREFFSPIFLFYVSWLQQEM